MKDCVDVFKNCSDSDILASIQENTINTVSALEPFVQPSVQNEIQEGIFETTYKKIIEEANYLESDTLDTNSTDINSDTNSSSVSKAKDTTLELNQMLDGSQIIESVGVESISSTEGNIYYDIRFMVKTPTYLQKENHVKKLKEQGISETEIEAFIKINYDKHDLLDIHNQCRGTK